jgi:hypothetical protein
MIFSNDDDVKFAIEWVQNPSGNLETPDESYCKTRDIFSARLDNLRSELNHKSSGYSLVIAICGEIGNNSFVRTTVADTGISLFFQSGEALCKIANGKVEFTQVPDRIQGCLAILSYVGLTTK